MQPIGTTACKRWERESTFRWASHENYARQINQQSFVFIIGSFLLVLKAHVIVCCEGTHGEEEVAAEGVFAFAKKEPRRREKHCEFHLSHMEILRI